MTNQVFITIVGKPTHTIDKGHLVQNLEKLDSRPCQDKRNGFLNGVDQRRLLFILSPVSKGPLLSNPFFGKEIDQNCKTSYHADKQQRWIG